MLRQIINVLRLIDFPYCGKMVFSIVGAAAVSLLEMVGVAASYPLLLLVTGTEIVPGNGIVGVLADIIGTTDRKTLIIATGVLVSVSFVLKSLTVILFRWWQLGFINQLERAARVNLFRGYLGVSYNEHRQKQIPQIHTNLATSVSQSYGQVILGLVSLCSHLFTIIFLLAIILFISPLAALIALVLFTGSGISIPYILRKKLHAIGIDMTEADRISWFSSIPALQAFREMRLFDVADNFVDTYRDGASLRASVNRRTSFYSELPKYLIEVIVVLCVVFLALLLFSLYSAEEAISIMGAFSVATVRMMPSVNAAIASVNQVRAGRAGLTILDSEVKHIYALPSALELSSNSTNFEGDIRIKNVSFSYSDGEPVLKNISLVIKRGTTVAFVGPSGSGKSTLVDIILGMLPPDQGQVLSGNIDIASDLRSWQNHLGVVPQRVVMIPGDLRTNIAFGQKDEEIDDASVINAARSADLDELVAGLTHGIYEDLGQEGNRLSGGQRQRLGIARALYREPSILVMDEATSALDNKTEYKITSTVEHLKGQLTTIIVAHRLSTIRHADKIFYIKNGEILSEGSFEELDQQLEDFSELVRLGKLL